MKLLLDQHFSYRLVARLGNLFPGTSHVRLLRLEKASDSDVWYYAKAHGFILVTKDKDMVDLAVLRGTPPKVVWLRLGNATTTMIEEALKRNQATIEELLRDNARSVLEVVA